MTAVHEEQAGWQWSPPASVSPEMHSSRWHISFDFFSSKLKNCARINSVGAEASQRVTNHSVAYFASVQGSSASSHLSFCTWELLCLAALPKDAAYSSCSCKPFKSTSCFSFSTYTDPSERQSSPPADAKIHFAPSSILPKSQWSSAQQPPAYFLLHYPFNSLWCFCCLHKAFQNYWSPLNFKAKHTNIWLCESTATHHEEWEPAASQVCYLDSKRLFSKVHPLSGTCYW